MGGITQEEAKERYTLTSDYNLLLKKKKKLQTGKDNSESEIVDLKSRIVEFKENNLKLENDLKKSETKNLEYKENTQIEIKRLTDLVSTHIDKISELQALVSKLKKTVSNFNFKNKSLRHYLNQNSNLSAELILKIISRKKK